MRGQISAPMGTEYSVPDSATRIADAAGSPLAAERGEEFSGDRMSLSMGPSHPSTHGVLRLQMELDGEVLTNAATR